MSEEPDKIQLDDISFDDVVSDVSPSDGMEDLAVEDVVEEVVEEEIGDDLEDDLEDDEEESYDDEEEEDYEEDYEDDDEESEYEPEEHEIEEGDEEVYEPSVVNEVLSNLGYDPDNEYEDSPEGLTQMTQDIASQIADDRIDNLLEAYPMVKEHLQYVMNGGESNTFLESTTKSGDYELLEIREDDINTQRNVLGNYLHMKGHEADFINELLEDYEDSGKLYGKSSAAKDAMAKYQQEHREQVQENQRVELSKQKEQNEEFWSGVANTIHDSREFAGIKITDKDKRSFYNYVSQPVDQSGKTQRDLDHQEADMEIKLAIDYLMYKGFNLEDIIGQRANTRSTASLRDKLSRNDESLKSSKKRRRTVKNVDFDDLDLSI